ncbi:sensor domain-containing diguanylate cyclase [Alteromonas sp. ASW11-130]|uniref:sensor domain-containing diguanylate cyclase n=1 Tax=Alteromonas sp. ASW11-130 TaxID=3015775 RepID=UPI0022422116|nr:sensor domain-containing diguanylate cyclase [Alteromonas sp. ASW11-130]MCW8093148.1 sensor domain-containing diguanylate cyclase [Alteromonas sp. ASW11-130]
MPTQIQLFEVIAIQRDVAKVGMDLSTVMDLVVKRILNLLKTDGAAIELKEGHSMVYRAASGIAADHLGMHFDVNASLSGYCVTTGKAQFCDDANDHPLVDKKLVRGVGIASMLMVPLIHQTQAVGVLKVMSKQPAAFKKTDLVLLNLLSEQIAAVIYFCEQLSKDKLLRLASRDEMTGLANRSVFMEQLRALISINHDSQTRFGIFIIDMDNLKFVNDTYGHRAGDKLIIEFATRLTLALPHVNIIARLGGDEFGVIVNSLGNDEKLSKLHQQISEYFYDDLVFEGNVLPLDASIGSAIFPDDGLSSAILIEKADQRMYERKRTKKREVRVDVADSRFALEVTQRHTERKLN